MIDKNWIRLKSWIRRIRNVGSHCLMMILGDCMVGYRRKSIGNIVQGISVILLIQVIIG